MHPVHRLAVLAGVAALAAALAAAPSAPASPTASAASLHRCHVGQKESEHFGPSYIEDISVHRVSCTEAKRVVRAFHACRRAHGGIKHGRCPTSASVLGFHCREKRSGIRTEVTGHVTCRAGTREVVHDYEELT